MYLHLLLIGFSLTILLIRTLTFLGLFYFLFFGFANNASSSINAAESDTISLHKKSVSSNINLLCYKTVYLRQTLYNVLDSQVRLNLIDKINDSFSKSFDPV